MIALTDWMVYTGELSGEYAYTLDQNSLSLAEGQVKPESVREGQTVIVDVRDLLGDTVNSLSLTRREGEGRLYYTTALNLRLPADEVEAANQGVSVYREYFRNELRHPTHEASVGDVITVRLTLTAAQDIYYFALEDVIPAGTEILDRRLLTTSQVPNQPSFVSRGDLYWYWGYAYFDRTELRDEGAYLYADFLPRGSYIFTYQVRAVTPGEFQSIPAQAFAFYQPEVYGRSDGENFVIRANTP